MNVIILAAGKGSRLSPLTDNKPKCMVKLFGKSLIEFQLSSFEKFNENSIINKEKKKNDCNVLNENNYIVPGLGDAGDRLFGTD